MGLISAFTSSVSGVLSDSWRDYFYCSALDSNTLVSRGYKKEKRKLLSRESDDNVISDGSIICVADGQCMLVVDQGRITEVCAEPGEFLYESGTQPSLMYGNLGASIVATFAEIGERLTFGGITASDQRVYYVNIKELTGNKYGTVTPVPFRVVDTNIGLDIDISIRCHGEYSYRIADPLRFFANVCGNVTDSYKRSAIDSQLKSEVMTAMQPAFAKISEMGIRYSSLPGHTAELSKAMNDTLSEQWYRTRGLEMVSFGVNSVTASKEDEDMIKELQRTGVFRNQNMAAAHLVGAQADAMKAAASNQGGAMVGFAGMNMAANAGGNVNALYQAVNASGNVSADSWNCSCGTSNTGKFCSNCGTAKPAPAGSWTCSCGSVNSGNFCSQCGSKKPSAEWTCSCGKVNSGNFCASCGTKKPQ